MEGLPSDVFSSTFHHLSTIELGLMMGVCKGWKEVLLGTSNLWRHIDLPTPKHTAKIIEVFARRSRNTLVSVKSPAESTRQEAEKVFSLLDLSKRTARSVDLLLVDFDSDVLPAIRSDKGFLQFGWCYDEDYEVSYDDVLHYFQSFPNLERLNMNLSQLPEVEIDVPGTLVMLGSIELRNMAGQMKMFSGSQS